MTEFISRHIGPTEEEQTQMLNDLGLSSLDELVRQVVPDSILLRGDSSLPEPCSEQQALQEIKEITTMEIDNMDMAFLVLWTLVTALFIGALCNLILNLVQ